MNWIRSSNGEYLAVGANSVYRIVPCILYEGLKDKYFRLVIDGLKVCNLRTLKSAKSTAEFHEGISARVQGGAK